MNAKKHYHAVLVSRASLCVFAAVEFCLRLREFCRKLSQVLRTVKVGGIRCGHFNMGLLEMWTGERIREIYEAVVIRV